MQSCRDVLKSLQGGDNASLLMVRYLRAALDGTQEGVDAKKDIFDHMRTAAAAAQPIYARAFHLRREALSGVSAARTFETLGPMIVGLGGSNVLETGLTLNTLYGTPMIPGASVKGIVAHYCSQVLGAADPAYLGPALDDRNQPTQPAGEIYEALFGKVDRVYNAGGTVSPVPTGEMSGGYLRFYDAWLEPDGLRDAFVDDVMTPHHGDYYGGKADLPTDFDDPNPVTFMAVQGRFEVRVGCEEPDPGKRREWLAFAMDLTQKALEAWGLGGKTRAGYGRMKAVLSAEETKARADQAKARELRESGWAHAEGEVLTVRCIEVKPFKGKMKRKFAIEGETDGKDVRFESVPEVEKGQTFAARVRRIDKANKAYIMEKSD